MDRSQTALTVRQAFPADRSAFLRWAAEVEPLFGPMVGVPEFEAAVDATIAAGDALVAVRDGSLLGGILVARESREIGWLVVGREARGGGAGRALLDAALALLGPGAVHVETFAGGIPEGEAARVLYSRAGFASTGKRGATPAGIETEVLLKP